jgi:undecaprenyl phosphate-alpha-L-ara4FN deformylase
LPTTLPTLDEVVGVHDDVVSHILGLTAKPSNHVFTAHAELEGGEWQGLFDRLLAGWREQGYEICSLKTLYESLDLASLPRNDVVLGEIPGRSGTLALQASGS